MVFLWIRWHDGLERRVQQMNQKKTGELLKQLRKEKNMTQEQLAERFYVSSRTVSRWETGSSLPDLGILVELADFYGQQPKSHYHIHPYKTWQYLP